MLNDIANNEKLIELCQKKVTPIFPFLDEKVDQLARGTSKKARNQNNKSGRFALELIRKGVQPNTPDWIKEFGTNDLFIPTIQRVGRRLFASKEEYDEYK